MVTTTVSHENHYRSRINSTYQEYFEKRYHPFLLECVKHPYIKEEGIGIGSVSKAMRKHGIRCYGSDISEEMLNLCRDNNPGILCFQEDILNREKLTISAETVVVTHGVLEHFTDDQIYHVLDQYDDSLINMSIHYVPTDKYSSPSIGDERLLPWAYWVETFHPDKIIQFNNQHDLVMVFKH